MSAFPFLYTSLVVIFKGADEYSWEQNVKHWSVFLARLLPPPEATFDICSKQGAAEGGVRRGRLDDSKGLELSGAPRKTKSTWNIKYLRR